MNLTKLTPALRTPKGRRIAAALVTATAGAAVVVPVPSASAAEIRVNFDGGTPGAPCNFVSTAPLRNQYAGVGIRFRGPSALDGGAVLDTCANFGGVNPRSGLRFLAFNAFAGPMTNGGTPRGPEHILFNKRMKKVSIWVSQGGGVLGTPTFKLVGKRNGNTIRTATATTNTADWVKLTINQKKGFDKAVLSVTGDPNRAWVADDLVVRR
ncbi:hypothetical protein [Nocardioides caldifontis]|uniref:hypothetical protein n=1 Tax=Nocardioides caldifontis TaxID=2588938 RepID=UPI0011DF02ED|nr:hypothetical protein [Nocardioides caldifontis]